MCAEWGSQPWRLATPLVKMSCLLSCLRRVYCADVIDCVGVWSCALLRWVGKAQAIHSDGCFATTRQLECCDVVIQHSCCAVKKYE